MGALHAGHLELVKRARKENDAVIVSIFVNPAQFGPGEDYARYPRPAGKDKLFCRKAGVDFLFMPSVKDMYAGGGITFVEVKKISEPLCGAFRPGHFRGVATVVAKLFNIILPGRAYFGMKDFQQVRVIESMVSGLNFPVRIVRVPTVRENDGLALSSRNRFLNPAQLASSPRIIKALQTAGEMIKCGKIRSISEIKQRTVSMLKNIPGAKVEYMELCDPRTLETMRRVRFPVLAAVAVKIGNTRLIDNILIENLKGRRK
jgi:pantoate--beta-alanine ligase